WGAIRRRTCLGHLADRHRAGVSALLANPGVHPFQTVFTAGMGALLLMEEVILRRLQAADLAAALKLTQAERWSHRMEDWEFHYRLGLGWAACDSTGKLLGTASWWAYGDAFATVGLVLVDQSCQGRGIGRKLM